MQWPNEKGQTTIYKILHRKLKIEQREPGVNSGNQEALTVAAPLVTPV